MKHRHAKKRVREIAVELVALIQERYPDVELISTSRWPTGMFEIRVYTPYDDFVDILEVCSGRLVQILVQEGIFAAVLPTRQKPARRVA